MTYDESHDRRIEEVLQDRAAAHVARFGHYAQALLTGIERIDGSGGQPPARELWLSQQHMIIVSIEAHGSVQANGGHYQLRPGTVFVFESKQPVRLNLERTGSRGLFTLTFRFPNHPEKGSRAGKTSTPISRVPSNAEWRLSSTATAVCDTIMKRWQAGSQLDRLGSQAAFQELLYLLLKEGKPAQREETLASIEQVRLYIDKQYYESFTIQRLAGMARINEKYFISQFKKMYGKSPIEYLTGVRMKEARTKLLQFRPRIADVARQVGYSDELYFSRMFRKSEGVSPSHFVKHSSVRVASYNYPITGQLLALQLVPAVAAYDPNWTTGGNGDELRRIDRRLTDDSHDRLQVWAANETTLRTAQPELIIGADYIDVWEKQQLDHIAPTHIMDWCIEDWRTQLLSIADLVRRRDVAEWWLARYERKVNETRDSVLRLVGNDTILPLLVMGDRYLVYGERNLSEVLCGDLHLRSALSWEDIRSIEPEELAGFDADRLIVGVGDYEEAEARWLALRCSPAWQNLKAVRMNKVYHVPLTPWFEYSAYAHERIVEQAASLFAEYRP